MIATFFLKAETESRTYLYVIQSITSAGVFLFPALLFSLCTTHSLFSYSKADKIVSLKMLGIVTILSFFILPVIAYLGFLNEQISLPKSMQQIELWIKKMEEANKILMHTLTANSSISVLFVNIVLMALLPSIFEELLFRGTLQPFFSKWFANKQLAIIVTAMIFSTIHFQFTGFIPRFLLGIYLGYLLVWGGSLWLPIMAHLMHNAVSLILLYFAQQRGIDLETFEPNQVKGFYPVIFCCIFCLISGIYVLYLCTANKNGKLQNDCYKERCGTDITYHYQKEK